MLTGRVAEILVDGIDHGGFDFGKERICGHMIQIYIFHFLNTSVRVLIVISLHFMQKSIHPDEIGVEISNNKHPARKTAGRQITNKLQIPISNDQNRVSASFHILSMFGILNFGHCDLFGI
jgi:hypothetical protein